LILQQFLNVITWSMSAALIIAAIGLATPKIWVMAVDPQVWKWGWFGGALVGGLLIGTLWTFLVRRGPLDAAMEMDHRFELKERISSALSLQPTEVETEAGQALVDDAVHRVERIDVRDKFPFGISWKAFLPLLPAAIALLVAYLPNATPDEVANAAASPPVETKRVKKSAEELKRRLERAEKKAHDKGLEDTDIFFKELQQGLDDLSKRTDIDRKNALVKINEMSKKLEERRDRLGGTEKMRQQLNRLKNIQQGPADKIAKALKDGDFQQAMDELKKLQQKLENGELNDEEKTQLAKQLDEVAQKLRETADAHEQAKRDLKEEIQRRQAAGDLEAAGKLQRQLDQMEQMNDQMKQLQQMAENLGQCKECLQNGNAQNAAQALDQLAEQLQELQDQLEQLETLDEVLDQIAQAKDCMQCGKCDGGGCEACMGQFMGQNGQKQGQGIGMGDGQGEGERPEERTDTGFYETQVRGELQRGEAVVTGSVSGPNRAGRSREDVKEQISSNLSEEADPLINVRLPRKQRQHTREYFESFRKGR
jgi:hypothetical protein